MGKEYERWLKGRYLGKEEWPFVRVKGGNSTWRGDEALNTGWSVELNVDVPRLGRANELVVGLNKGS